MTKIINLLTTLCFGLFCPLSSAQNHEPPLEQFAQGYRLLTDGQSAIYRLPLPDEIYRTVVRADLGDVRVFNDNGEVVPHAVRKPEQIETQQSVEIVLPFFPIPGDADSLRENSNIDVTVADNGRIIQIHARDAEATTPNVTAEYLIDLSLLNQTVDELIFELTGDKESYVKQVSLSSSDNLNDWQPYVTNATLARLDYSGHSLKKDRVILPNLKVKYLRFKWLGDGNGLQLNSVRAIMNTAHTTRERRWNEVAGKRAENDAQTIIFDTGGLFPIDHLELSLPEENTLIEATLSSRPDNKAGWTTHYSGLFYKLQFNGNYLERGSMSVALTTDRYWQLRVNTPNGMGAQFPVFKFGWVPNELFFLARGAGPYTLAYGNGQIGAPGKPIDALMNVLSDDQASLLTGRAELAEPIQLLGKDALAPQLEIPWQRILLWVILITGVVVIGLMAYRLIKQINLAG